MGENFLSQLANNALFDIGKQNAFNAVSGTIPSMFQQFSSTGLGGAGGNLFSGNLGSAVGSTGSGLFSNIGNLLGNEKLLNTINAGTGLFNAYKQFEAGNKAMDLLDKKEERAADAYRRDVEADNRRRLLNF